MVKKPAQTDARTPIGMSVNEAGRRGGLATLENHGRDFYRQIGKKGGERTAELYRDLLRQFGQRGGRPRRPTPWMNSRGRKTGDKGGDLRSVPQASSPTTF